LEPTVNCGCGGLRRAFAQEEIFVRVGGDPAKDYDHALEIAE